MRRTLGVVSVAFGAFACGAAGGARLARVEQAPAPSAEPLASPSSTSQQPTPASSSPAPSPEPPSSSTSAPAATSAPLNGGTTDASPIDPAAPANGDGVAGPHTVITLDHSHGTPLQGVCDLRLVKWKSTPSLFGVEQLVQVADEAEATRLRVRSYAVLKPQYADTNRDGKPDIATVVVRHWAPEGATGLSAWAELNFFAVRDCVVGSTAIIRAELSPAPH